MGGSQSVFNPHRGATPHHVKPEKEVITSEDVEWFQRRSGCYRNLNHGHGLILGSFLPVHGLPRIEAESCFDDGRLMFSIRGKDDALYRAYYDAFMVTWGSYVVIREPPSKIGDGEWYVIGWTTPQIWDIWFEMK